MKIILSRKGFDSEFGKTPSPILPDNRLLSLPIPSTEDSIRFSDLLIDSQTSYYDIIHSLTSMRKKYPISETNTCHLDPDIYKNAVLNRSTKWLPLFGQVGAAQTHLASNQVSVGDLFLFFGWFRHTMYDRGKLRYDPKRSYDLHVIFGYFEIGRIIETPSLTIPTWMHYHPHIANQKRRKNRLNCLYIARPTLSWNKSLPGASPFFQINENLILTKRINRDYLSRSKWYFNKSTFGKKISITYHNENNWKKDYFQSAWRGQEFIFEEIIEVEKWGKRLIDSNIPPQ